MKANDTQLSADQLLKMMSRPVVKSHRPLGSSVERQLFAGYRLPDFAPAAFDPVKPQAVGMLGNFTIHLDSFLKVSRQVVSVKFRSQFPDLADDLQKWMNDFFGFDYPIYTMEQEKIILMHPEAFEQLKQKLGVRK